MRGVVSHWVGLCAVALTLAAAAAARGDAVLLPGSTANETALPFDPTSGLPQEPSSSTAFTTLPSLIVDSANVTGASTVGTYNLGATQFVFDLVHDARGTGSGDTFQATSEGNLLFQVTEATTYTISGSQTVGGSQADALALALVSLTPAGEADLFFGVNTTFPLAATQVDLGTPLSGAATGTLLPGVTYSFDYLFSTSNTQATTHLQLSLTPGEVAVVPLPGAAWGGLALLGVLGAAHVRRRYTALVPA